MQEAIVQNRTRRGRRDARDGADYVFVAAIAKGGMGSVELCCRRDGRFVRWAARKRLHEQLRTDQTFRTRFMDEARLAGLIRHPNVVGVSEVGEDDLAELLLQMLDKNAGHRPATAVEVAGRLERIFVDSMTREGAVMVADYMDENFASARDQHRVLLAQRLRATIERPTPVAAPQIERRFVRPRHRRWLLWLGAAAAMTVAASVGIRSTGQHETASPAPRLLATAMPSRVELVPQSRSQIWATPMAVATIAPAPTTRARTSETRPSHYHSSHRPGARRLALQAGGARSGEQAIPLYTQWR